MDLSQVSPGLWLAVLAANSLGGLLKENDRAGLPLFAVPALAAITLVEDAVVLMVFPSVGANLWLVMNHRRYRNLLREHLPFLVTGFIGGLSGTGLLVLVSDRGLKLLLVIWLGLYLIRYFSNRNSLKLFGADRKSGYPLGLAAGTIQGSTGISAPVVAPYYHTRGLAPEAYAFAVAFTFLLFSVSEIIAMANLQLLTTNRIRLSLAALVPSLVFTRLGISLSRKISIALFNKFLLTIFILMAIKLIMDIL